ncbi:MAG TPA: xanthine dehydrogenase family protein subunit M [Candidatus Dormibacteraeota bacterium]|nr:xanthine dehydrogenase family protein subunit M [Candidatus Dormibacteraeota bacterium]
MKPPAFAYRAPESLEEALTLLAELGDDAKVLAGGQSLIPLLSLRLARPAFLVDLARIPGLASIHELDGWLVVGAMVREGHAERSSLIHRLAPLLSAALPFIGHPAIRSRGTVGGSLAHADPAAELPAVALAMDAQLVAASAARGQRTLPAGNFFRGFFETALEPDEILTEIRLSPVPPGTGVCFQEVARRHGDFAMVGVATTVRLEDGEIAEARLALTGVSPQPIRAREAEMAMVGAVPSDNTFEAAAETATTRLSPPSDLHGSSEYRRHVARVLVRRALQEAARSAGFPPAEVSAGRWAAR